MSLLLDAPAFPDHILELLGKTREQILVRGPRPAARIEGLHVERFIWAEAARDQDTGKLYPISLMARLYDGRTWAVGIRGDEFFFIVERTASGDYRLAAIPKQPSDGPLLVNWISKSDDKLVNWGVGY